MLADDQCQGTRGNISSTVSKALFLGFGRFVGYGKCRCRHPDIKQEPVFIDCFKLRKTGKEWEMVWMSVTCESTLLYKDRIRLSDNMNTWNTLSTQRRSHGCYMSFESNLKPTDAHWWPCSMPFCCKINPHKYSVLWPVALCCDARHRSSLSHFLGVNWTKSDVFKVFVLSANSSKIQIYRKAENQVAIFLFMQ